MLLARDLTFKNEVLPGFEKITRFHCIENNLDIVKILPGEFYVTCSNEIIATVLGSCISVCIRDVVNDVGGMNHFMLPKNKNTEDDAWKYNKIDKAARYGADAMEHLINYILKHGGKRSNFEVKLCGGGQILEKMSDIGKKNIDFIHHYLQTENLPIICEDLGSVYPRKVRYFPMTGKLQIKKLKSLHNDTIIQRENNYQKKLIVAPIAGEIELF